MEMVAKSFKICGISNSLDGTEDDELYNEEVQEIDDEEDNKFEKESEGPCTRCWCTKPLQNM